MTGGFASIVDFGIFVFLLDLSLPVAQTAIISFSIAALINYNLTSTFVFKENKSLKRFILFFLFAIFGLLINVSITIWLTTVLLFPAVFSKISAIGVTFLVNFIMNFSIVFRKPN